MSGLAHADEGGEHAAATGPVVALMVLMELATPERAELRRNDVRLAPTHN